MRRRVPRSSWSTAAEAAYERYSGAVPKYGGSDALQCDHVYPIVAKPLRQLDGPDAWIATLPGLTKVVVVTADENNRALRPLERQEVERPIAARSYGTTLQVGGLSQSTPPYAAVTCSVAATASAAAIRSTNARLRGKVASSV